MPQVSRILGRETLGDGLFLSIMSDRSEEQGPGAEDSAN